MAGGRTHSDQKWKSFEKVVAEIYRQLAPGAQVTHDEKLPSVSGGKRQCDVVVRQQVAGTYTALTVIECRNKSRPLDIGSVDAFVSKLDDVRANAGIMISTSGFTEKAIAKASHKRLQLMTHREAEHADWRALIGSSSWLVLIAQEWREVSVRADIEGIGEGVAVPLDAMLRDSTGQCVGTVQRLHELWHAHLRREMELVAPGPFHLQLATTEPVWVWVDGGPRRLLCLRLDGVWAVTRYPVCTSFGSGHILTDCDQARSSYGQLISSSIDVRELLRSTPGVEAGPEELAAWIKGLPAGSTIAALDPAKPYLRATLTLRGQKLT